METAEVCIPLPEEVVERILALVPFPQVFKARVLSKSWLARLSPASSVQDQGKKRLAISFQEQMGEYWRKTWKTFCPVFFGADYMLAYDRECDHWRRLPALPKKGWPLLGVSNSTPGNKHGWRWQLEGALVLTSAGCSNRTVSNVLTQTCKDLPPCPDRGCDDIDFVSHRSSQTYKVIQFPQNGSCLWIYDSRLGVWRRRTENWEGFVRMSNRVSFNGVSYWVLGDQGMPTGLLVFQFEEEAFEVFPMPPTGVPRNSRNSHWVDLLVCNDSMMMVSRTSKIVFQIDLGSRQWFEVTRGPSTAFNTRVYSTQSVSDGDLIFFFVGGSSNFKVHTYNVPKDEWSYFPVPEEFIYQYGGRFLTFRPGLNAFVEV